MSAKNLAKMVHINERRRNGEPYYRHCERVANRVEHSFFFEHPFETYTHEQENMISAAWLHDTVENAENPDEIIFFIEEYFPHSVLSLVLTLTKRELIAYEIYIKRICTEPKALVIKFADMIDNTTDNIPEKQKTKYRDACIYIMSEGIEVPKILKDRLNL